jgi:signal recognition particle subunit SRP54
MTRYWLGASYHHIGKTKEAIEEYERARADGVDAVIVDTAGRLQIDEQLMDELERVRDAAQPSATVLVLDAMTGQEAVNVARAFDERLDVTGVLFTKLDALEVFHPDRMASRILGMGDVLTLIERAEQAASADEQAEMESRLRKGQFTFDDFLQAQRMLRRMGPLQGILKLMPGMGELANADVDESQMKRVEAIVLSMTPHERAVPHAIDGRRRERIARGSGTSVPEVNKLLEARKLMERLMKQMGQGKMPSLPGLAGLGGPGGMPGAPGTTRHPGSKRKKGKGKARRR